MVKGKEDRGRGKSKGPGHRSLSKLRKRQDVRCYKCREKGHFKRECPQRQKGKAEEKKSDSFKTANLVEDDPNYDDGDMLLVSSDTANSSVSWVLDSTCSFHMMPYKDWFDTYRSTSGFVQMGNDASYKVTGIGAIKIKMFDGVF